MTRKFDVSAIAEYQRQLNAHTVYGAVRDLEGLRRFMAHHVYSVWDFMSLIKYLQRSIAPADYPWAPVADPSVRRFINSLVLEEESDEGLPDADGNATFASHFELYCGAMREVGADPAGILSFLEVVRERGIDAALAAGIAPEPSRAFTSTTFEFIASDKPHVVAAALAVGREHVIPGMFRAFLDRRGIDARQAPIFDFYLKRHIHLDEDFHAPLSLRLLDELCGGDPLKVEEAQAAGARAIQERIRFWDGVAAAISA